MTIEPVFDNDCDLSLVACLESLDRQLVGQTPPPCDKLRAQRDHVREIIIVRGEAMSVAQVVPTPKPDKPARFDRVLCVFGWLVIGVWVWAMRP